MRVVLKMFFNMVKQITQEMMMILLIIAPFLAGAFFRFGIPFLEKNILSRYGFEHFLVPYYEIFSWLLAMLTGMLFAFVGGLVVLGEIDDNITKYFMVTPAGMIGYISSRIVIPAVISGIVALFCVPVFSLIELSFPKIIVMVISTVLSGIVTAMLVVAISSNKVEGMAVGKLSGLFGITLFVPILIKGMIKYVFCIFPMFWVGQWSMSGSLFALIIAAAEFGAWIYLMFVMFRRKTGGDGVFRLF